MVRPARLRCLLLVVLAAQAFPNARAAPVPAEHQVKAAFLYNFARFVDWPAWALDGARSPFIIGVLGDDPIADTLTLMLADKDVRGHPIEVHRWSEARDIDRAHILYIGPEESFVLPRVLQSVEGRPVLTVADIDAFAERGGMVGFRVEDRRVRFDINIDKATEAGLSMSSQLLKLARIVSSRRS